MKQYLDLSKAIITGESFALDMSFKLKDTAALKITSKSDTYIEFSGKDGRIAGAEFAGDKILVVPVYFEEKHSVYFKLEFYENKREQKHIYTDVAMGVMPDIEVDIIYDLKNLDLGTLFLRRTPGRLKNTSTGTPTSAEKLDNFTFKIPASNEMQTVTVGNPYITDQYPKNEIPKRPLVDKIGQWKKKEWKNKTKNEAEMTANYKKWLDEELPVLNEKFSVYGGDASKKYPANGYFSTIFEDGRWYMLDPDGYRFYSVGVDCVNANASGPVMGIEGLFEELPPEDGLFTAAWYKRRGINEVCFLKSNLIRAFGADWSKSWERLTAKRLRAWGFNTIANWSEKDFGKNNKIPYVIETPFPDTGVNIFRDFPDVFAEEYRINAEKCAAFLENYKEDKYLIGYFLCNEPNWAFGKYNLAKFMLENKYLSESKKEFARFISDNYINIENFNKAWNTSFNSFEDIYNITEVSLDNQNILKDTEEFTRKLIYQYVKVPSEACKKIDANHMNLGLRWAWIASEDFYLGSEFFDVFSINCYNRSPNKDEIEYIAKKTGRPVVIGEFHAGALDVGLPANALQGVVNQSERGYFYSYYMENGATIPSLVGAHYFQYNDQAVLGRFDGENLNIGLCDICGRPYDDMISKVCETNRKIYEIRKGEKKPTEREAAGAVREGF